MFPKGDDTYEPIQRLTTYQGPRPSKQGLEDAVRALRLHEGGFDKGVERFRVWGLRSSKVKAWCLAFQACVVGAFGLYTSVEDAV